MAKAKTDTEAVEEFSGSGVIQRVSQLESGFISLKETMYKLDAGTVQRQGDAIGRLQEDYKYLRDHYSEIKKRMEDIDHQLGSLKAYVEAQQAAADENVRWWKGFFDDLKRSALKWGLGAMVLYIVYGILRQIERAAGIQLPW